MCFPALLGTIQMFTSRCTIRAFLTCATRPLFIIHDTQMLAHNTILFGRGTFPGSSILKPPLLLQLFIIGVTPLGLLNSIRSYCALTQSSDCFTRIIESSHGLTSSFRGIYLIRYQEYHIYFLLLIANILLKLYRWSGEQSGIVEVYAVSGYSGRRN
jgi:hypothetical protein